MNIKVRNLPNFEGRIDFAGRKIFDNWVWAYRGKLARSSAPNYTDKLKIQHHDQTQRVTRDVADYLSSKLIGIVVSLNYFRLSADQEQLLNAKGILYHHVPVEDYHPPTKDQLIHAEEQMRNRISLVWCGFGQGRTGTMVTAWEILTGRKDKETAIKDSTAETRQQKLVLRSLPERKLPLFIGDVCHALREYERSKTKGISLGLGRTASLFGLRNTSDASVNIVNTLNQAFKASLDIESAQFRSDLPEADLLRCCDKATENGLNYFQFRQFIEWAADRNPNPGFFGGAQNFGFPDVMQTGRAGATLRSLLVSAMTNFDRRRIGRDDRLA